MEADLKPCPFCGGNEVKVLGTLCPCVTCKKCQTKGPTGKSKEGAIKLWNKRSEKQ